MRRVGSHEWDPSGLPSENPEHNHGARHLWLYLDTCPSQESVDVVLDYIEQREGAVGAAEPRVRSALRAFGELARAGLRARIEADAPGAEFLRAVLDEEM